MTGGRLLPAWQAVVSEHARQARLGELWGKRFDDPTGLGPHLREVLEGEQMIRVGERYVDAEVALHAHLRIRSCDGDTDSLEVCVWATRAGVVANGEIGNAAVPLRDGKAREGLSDLWQIGKSLSADVACVRSAVLVAVAEEAEEPEGVTLGVLWPSYKGLEILDDFLVADREATSRFADVSPLPPIDALGDGEFVRLGDSNPAMFDEGAEEVVEDRADMKRELAYVKEPLGWRLPFDVEDVLRCVRFEAFEDSVVYVVKEGAPFVVERGKTFVCSIEPSSGGDQ